MLKWVSFTYTPHTSIALYGDNVLKCLLRFFINLVYFYQLHRLYTLYPIIYLPSDTEWPIKVMGRLGLTGTKSGRAYEITRDELRRRTGQPEHLSGSALCQYLKVHVCWHIHLMKQHFCKVQIA